MAEGFRLEQDLKDLFALSRCGGEEFSKFTLRQEYDMAELAALEA